MSTSVSRTPSVSTRAPQACHAPFGHVREAIDPRLDLWVASEMNERDRLYHSAFVPEQCSPSGHDDNSSRSSSDDDTQIVLAVGDYVADESGAIGRSRRDLRDFHLAEKQDSHPVVDSVSCSDRIRISKRDGCGRRESSLSSFLYDNDLHRYGPGHSTDNDDDDIVLQAALLRSMTIKQEDTISHQISDSSVPQMEDSLPPKEGVILSRESFKEAGSLTNPTSAQLGSATSFCWADIDDDDSEEDSPNDLIRSKTLPRSEEPRPPCAPVDLPLTAESRKSFASSWTAWYDPPKGKVARLGISKDSYEQSLFEMGVVQTADDFWAVHGMVDWSNMPVGSMLSFSRCGSKPFWEDAIHCHGGRWIIRGISSDACESFFAKLVLLLFLEDLPESNEFTCATLQIKDRRRGNAIQLWTRSTDSRSYAQALHEQLSYLVDGGKPKPSKKRRGKGGTSDAKALQFEFCHNSEAIERNASKLGELVVPVKSSGTTVTRSVGSVALKCEQVATMYSEAKSRTKKAGGRYGVPATRWKGINDLDLRGERPFRSSGGGSSKQPSKGIRTTNSESGSGGQNNEIWRCCEARPSLVDEENWRERKDQEIHEDHWLDQDPGSECDPQLVNRHLPGGYQGVGWTAPIGGWAGYPATPAVYQDGCFDSHGCWYPMVSQRTALESQSSQNGLVVKGSAVTAGNCSTGESTACSTAGRSGSFGRGESSSDHSVHQSPYMCGDPAESLCVEYLDWNSAEAADPNRQFFYSGGGSHGYFHPWMNPQCYPDQYYYVSSHSTEISKLADSVVASTQP